MESYSSSSLVEAGVCSVCGDKSAGKHYGVVACYGCKGFFRRTIRSKQTYSCRFQQHCRIDKDQRNCCRYCRFARCIQVGMEVGAIRPDRDVIGKQKNPRKRKLLMIKTEDNLLPSLGNDSNSLATSKIEPQSQQEDLLLGFLMEVDMKGNGQGEFCDRSLQLQTYDSNMNSYGNGTIDSDSDISMNISMGHQISLAIGIANPSQPSVFHQKMIKTDPDINLFALFQNSTVLEECRNQTVEVGTIANMQQFSEAMRKYVLMSVEWINSLFMMAGMEGTAEKVSMLKNSFAAFCTFDQAARTAKLSTGPQQSLVLCNGAIIPRDFHREVLDTNLLSNNIVGKIIDELAPPIRQLQLSEQERVVLTTLIILEGDYRSSIYCENNSLYSAKDRLQYALFQHVRERCGNSVNRAGSRFANILLLLPSVARVSSIYSENAQLAKMFGRQSLDPLLAEIFLDLSNMTSSSTPGSSTGPLSASASFIGVNTGQQFKEQFCYSSDESLLLTTLPAKQLQKNDVATQTFESFFNRKEESTTLNRNLVLHTPKKLSMPHFGPNGAEFFLNNSIGIAAQPHSMRKMSLNFSNTSPPQTIHARHSSGSNVPPSISSAVTTPTEYNGSLYYQHQQCFQPLNSAFQQQQSHQSFMSASAGQQQVTEEGESSVPNSAVMTVFSDSTCTISQPHVSSAMYHHRPQGIFYDSSCSPIAQEDGFKY